MAKQRSAHASLRGYRYQLDASVLAILGASQQQAVTLEGIEDIDRADSEYIQCKYLESKAPWPSVIKEPVLDFFRHAQQNPGASTYTLYAHFGYPAVEQPTNDRIANALDAAISAEGYTRADLMAFLNTRYRFIEADEIDAHTQRVRKALAAALVAPLAEVDMFFYHRALSEVFRLAAQADASARRTTRSAFLATVNKREALFRHFLARLRGVGAYVKYLRDETDRLGVLESTKWVVVHLAAAQTESLSIAELGRLVVALAACRFLEEHHLRSARPLTLVFSESETRMADLKRCVLSRNLSFNDGREDLGFIRKQFDVAPVVEVRCQNTRLTNVIARASYCVRLARAESFAWHASALETFNTLVVVGNGGALPYQVHDRIHVMHIDDLSDVDHLVEILKRGPRHV